MDASQYPTSPDPADPRQKRARVVLDCEVRQGVRPWTMTRLEDISPNGFRIAWFPNCRPEVPVRIRIPGLEMLSAYVRWQRENSVGCEFTAPLHVAVFDHIVRRANSY